MHRFDVARILVKTTSMELINKVIKVQINQDNFHVRITEDVVKVPQN